MRTALKLSAVMFGLTLMGRAQEAMPPTNADTTCMPTEYLTSAQTKSNLYSRSHFCTSYMVSNNTSYVRGTNTYEWVSDDAIRDMARNGRICKVIGHFWTPWPQLTLEYSLDVVAGRQCGICGLRQSQRVGEWK